MHLESRLQTGWECENRGGLPFFRRIPVATDSDCVECDDQQLAYQRGTVIHVPILVRSGEGYGKLADWVYDSSDATLAATGRSHVGYPDDTVGLYDKHSRGLAIRDAAHAVELDWRPIRFRQNILALFRIPASGPYRAAKLHEHQDSGFDDNETIGIIEGYGKLLKVDFHDSACDSHFGTNEQVDGPVRRDRDLD